MARSPSGPFAFAQPSPVFGTNDRDGDDPHRPIMHKPEKVPSDERPHGWQYPAGVLFILLMALIAWLLLR